MSVKERPILFNGEMVRALLDRRKTETRRVIKRKKKFLYPGQLDFFLGSRWWVGEHPGGGYWGVDNPDGPAFAQPGATGGFPCPYGQVGDELWVREKWKPHIDYSGALFDCVKYDADKKLFKPKRFPNKKTAYKFRDDCNLWGDEKGTNYKSPIYMPRWASRIQLRITEIRVERVQDITDAGAIAEGIKDRNKFVPGGRCPCLSPSQHYEFLWFSINEKRGYGWDSNPWVWVVVFEVINGN